MGGWAVAVSAVMVMANVGEITGKYFWLLLGNEAFASDRTTVVITSVVFIAIMTIVSTIGVQLGERMQMVLMVIQLSAMVLFAVFAVVGSLNGSNAASASFNPEWFDITQITSFSGFMEAVLLALFIYWGWDSCLALNEETKKWVNLAWPLMDEYW